MYDDNFYFNNPVDYMANQNDSWFLDQYRSSDIHLATGCGPWGEQRPDLPNVRGAHGAAASLIIWTTGAPKGGHEWPYWHHQMWGYVGAHF